MNKRYVCDQKKPSQSTIVKPTEAKKTNNTRKKVKHCFT